MIGGICSVTINIGFDFIKKISTTTDGTKKKFSRKNNFHSSKNPPMQQEISQDKCMLIKEIYMYECIHLFH
jgi:hypothetical protein